MIQGTNFRTFEEPIGLMAVLGRADACTEEGLCTSANRWRSGRVQGFGEEVRLFWSCVAVHFRGRIVGRVSAIRL